MGITGGLKQMKEECALSGEGAGRVIDSFFDKGTFSQTLAYAKKGADGFEMSVTGYGAVNGKLVYAYIEDSTRNTGGFSEGSEVKFSAIASLAAKNSAPLVAFFDCKGAEVDDGFSTLAAYGRAMKSIAQAKEIVPTFAVINGTCTGAQAIIASLFDIVIINGEKYEFGANPEFISGGNEKGDILAKDQAEALCALKSLLSYIPSSVYDYCQRKDTADDANRSSASLEQYIAGGENEQILKTIADNGDYILFGKECKDILTGFMTLNGISTGFVLCTGEKMTVKGIKRASEAVKFFDRFSLPVVTFVNTDGYCTCKCALEHGMSSYLADLTETYINASTIKLTAVVKKSFGSVTDVLCSKNSGADYVLACESAVIAPLSPEAEAHFLHFDEIKNSADPDAKKKELIENYSSKYGALEAAKAGLVDDIAEYGEFRQKLISALEMLSYRA